MKKIINIVAIAVMASLLGSCETSFLDSKNESSLVVDNQYKTVTDYEMALTGCYQCLGSSSWGTYGLGMPCIGEIGTDEVRVHPSRGGNSATLREIDPYITLDGTSQVIQAIWSMHYQGINRTNLIILNIGRRDRVDGRFVGIAAEARFLQALWYFNLVRIYGGVPILPTDEDIDVTQAWARQRNTIEEVYAHINKLLEDATEGIPETCYNGQHGRAYRMSVYALLAKVNLQIASSMKFLAPTITDDIKLGGINSYDWNVTVNGRELSREETINYYYTRARDYAKVVLDYFGPSESNILMPKFEDCFYPNESSKEILFEAVFSTAAQVGQEQGGFLASLFGPGGALTDGGGMLVLQPMGYIVFGKYAYWYTGKGDATVWNTYDKRFMKTISTFQMTAGGGQAVVTDANGRKQFQIGKFQGDPSPAYNQDRTPVNYPILRTSEVCLIYAEAQAELDGAITPEALRYLNVVRRRAGIMEYTALNIKEKIPLILAPGATPLTLDQTGNKEILGYTDETDLGHFRRAILNERVLELLGEGHRWYDLVRFGLLKQLTDAATAAFVIDQTNQAVPRNIQPYHIFRPLPSNQISIHRGNLKQNFGYAQ